MFSLQLPFREKETDFFLLKSLNRVQPLLLSLNLNVAYGKLHIIAIDCFVRCSDFFLTILFKSEPNGKQKYESQFSQTIANFHRAGYGRSLIYSKIRVLEIDFGESPR